MKLNSEIGQHFLMDPDILDKEVEIANIKKNDKVIEIGCGGGFLTKKLVDKAKKVLGFEIDKRCESFLKKVHAKNLIIKYENALNSSWKGYNKIVSNIPYSISEPMILKAIKDEVPELVLVIGENFKELLEDKQTKIGIIASFYFNIEPIQKVVKEKFDPIPSVDSWMIHLRKKIPNKIEKDLRQFLEYEGKIKNSLINLFMSKKKTKKEAKAIIKKMDLHEFFLNKSVKKISAKGLLLVKEEIQNIY